MKVFSLLSWLEIWLISKEQGKSNAFITLYGTVCTLHLAIRVWSVVYLFLGLPEPPADRRFAPHFLYCFPVSWSRTDRVSTMRILAKDYKQHWNEYLAPEAEVIIIKNEQSFLVSGDDDDNEHTEEEDLF